MGYRLYAHIKGKRGDYCFGKLFGYRIDEKEISSRALHFLVQHTSFLADNFDEVPFDNEIEIYQHICDLFDSEFKFVCRMSKLKFMMFISLYAIEAGERWENEAEDPERAHSVVKHHLNMAFSLVYNSPERNEEVILEWL